MRYAIIENEEFSRLNLRAIIESLRPEYKCVFMAESVKESIGNLQNKEVDLIFMDIELDDGSCFEIFSAIDLHIPIIFTTAYDEYALRAFKVNSVDYLLKPVMEKDVEPALAKFERLAERITDKSRDLNRDHSSGRIRDYSHDYSNVVSEMQQRAHGHLLISTASGYYFVNAEEIAWVEAGDKCISIMLKEGTSRITDFTSLSEVQKVLDPALFFQISRSVVASIESISRISKYFKGRLRVELKAGTATRTETITASRRPDFLEWLGHSSK